MNDVITKLVHILFLIKCTFTFIIEMFQMPDISRKQSHLLLFF